MIGDDGVPHDVTSDDVNEYLREISGIDMTAKDFRTWAGTVLAYRALRALAPVEDGRAAKRNVVEAVKLTAGRLGNTPAVARQSYVHPAILEAYLDGAIGGALLEAAENRPTRRRSPTPTRSRGREAAPRSPQGPSDRGGRNAPIGDRRRHGTERARIRGTMDGDP
jgi:DNA topoisomerase-1